MHTPSQTYVYVYSHTEILVHMNTQTHPPTHFSSRTHAHFMQILVFLGSLLVASLVSSLIWEFVYGEVSNTLLAVVCCAQANSHVYH